jgi:hypothetical protein
LAWLEPEAVVLVVPAPPAPDAVVALPDAAAALPDAAAALPDAAAALPAVPVELVELPEELPEELPPEPHPAASTNAAKHATTAPILAAPLRPLTLCALSTPPAFATPCTSPSLT